MAAFVAAGGQVVWRSLLPFALLAVAVAVAAPVPAPSGKLAPVPDPDPDAADYDKPPKGALFRLGSRQMRHPQGYVGDYAADGRTLFTAGPGRVCEWDTGSNTLRRVIPLPDTVDAAEVRCSPDGRLVLVKDFLHLHVFDRATKKRLHTLGLPELAVERFAVSPDSRHVAVSVSDHHLRQFDLTSGELVKFTASHPLPPPTPDEIVDPTLARRKSPPAIWSLAWSPDGKTVVSCSQGEGVVAWNSLSGEKRWAFDTGGAYGRVAYSADGKRLYVPMKSDLFDGLAALDPATGERAVKLHGFGAPFALAASADGRFLCNGKAVWDTTANKQAQMLRPNYWTKGLAVSPDGKRLALAPDGVRLFDLPTGKELFDDTGHADEVTAVAASPDGKQVATAAKDGTIRLWDATPGKQVRVVHRSEEEPRAVAFSPDGKHLAVAEHLNLWVYELATGKRAWTTRGYGLGKHLEYSPDGKTLACGGRGLTVRLFDAATGEGGQTLVGETALSNLAFRFAWTPDSTGIVSPVNLMPKPKAAPVGGPGGEGDGKFRVVLWDVATGDRVRTLGEPAEKCPPSVAISPDGKHVAVGGKTVSLADWKSGKQTWTADVTGEHGLAFDGDDHLYADGVKLGVKTGMQDGGLKIDAKTLRALAIPPKGKTVLTASADDNTVVVWPR